MEQDPKNYELTYLLSPSLNEEEVLAHTATIHGFIEEHKGIIKHVQQAKKQKLAYAIAKGHTAYFGWTAFRANPDTIAGIEKKLKTENSILRYLIVEGEERMKAPVFRTPVAKPGTQKSSPIPREAEKSEEKLDLEALDKKLEEILGK